MFCKTTNILSNPLPMFCSVLFKRIKVTFPCRGCTCYRIFHHVFTCGYGPKNLLTYSGYKAGCVWFTTRLYLIFHNPNYVLNPNSLFSNNSLSIVFGIRTGFSFQFKNATLTQNCEVHKSVRLKGYSIEEKKIVAQRKNKSNSNSF